MSPFSEETPFPDANSVGPPLDRRQFPSDGAIPLSVVVHVAGFSRRSGTPQSDGPDLLFHIIFIVSRRYLGTPATIRSRQRRPQR